jgi:hypothetical protein
MAQEVFTDAYVSINSVDLSDHVKSVKLNYQANGVDGSAMSNLFAVTMPGLKSWDLEIEFYQDYALAKVDATMFSLVGAAAFAVALRPKSAVQSATNPTFAGNALCLSYQPMGGAHGDAHMAPVSLRGTGTLTRTAT